jgi:glycosyltransferase involved in cell wall biosynthesis
MASGCAVVAAADGNNHGVITDGEDGLLVPTGSSEALASAITRLLVDRPLRRELGNRAVATVRDRFGSDVVCAETAETYRSLLD